MSLAKTAATPLLTPAQMECAVYGKLEMAHPSGSLKHRAIVTLLEQLLRQGELSAGQPIIIHSAGSAAITAAWAGAGLGCPVHALVPRSVASGVTHQLRWLGARCHAVRSAHAAELIAKLVREQSAYVLDQARETRLIDHYQPIAQEIVEQCPQVDAVVTGIGTGASLMGIARGLRRLRPSCRIIGVEPAECQVAAGKPWAPHRISGLAPPFPQFLLDSEVPDAIVPVASTAAWQRARRLAREAGWMVGPAAGAAVQAAIEVRRRMALEHVVAVLGGGIAPLLGDDTPL